MRNAGFIGLWMLASVVLTCAGSSHRAPASPVEDGEVRDLRDLRRDLEERGSTTELGDEVEQPFFAVTGRFLRVDDEEVQVFQYPDEEARRADSKQISPDGRTIGKTKPMWIGTPRFWARGRLVVLYLGDDEAVIEAVSDPLGPTLAGPRHGDRDTDRRGSSEEGATKERGESPSRDDGGTGEADPAAM